MIHIYSGKKDELFYNENYRNKKEKIHYKKIMEFLKKVNLMKMKAKVELLILI